MIVAMALQPCLKCGQDIEVLVAALAAKPSPGGDVFKMTLGGIPPRDHACNAPPDPMPFPVAF